MNYLAHAYLSFGHPEIIVGNLISDFVKGKTKFQYSPGIQNGINLHRAIDGFTDTHEATALAKNIFRPYYRLYSGAFTDVVYDHFLATDPNEFTDKTLQVFSEGIYEVLNQHAHQLPDQFARIFPYMKSQNWLFNYRTKEGTEASFGGLVRRARYLAEANTASTLFEKCYMDFKTHYQAFFPDVKSFAYKMYEDMVKL